MPQRLLDESTVVVVGFVFLFYKAKSVHRFLSTHENAPVVNILVTSKRKVKYLSSSLAQNKHKFEQMGLNRKYKRWHTIHSCSQRKKVINIPAVDIRVNKIFINLAPNGK